MHKDSTTVDKIKQPTTTLGEAQITLIGIASIVQNLGGENYSVKESKMNVKDQSKTEAALQAFLAKGGKIQRVSMRKRGAISVRVLELREEAKLAAEAEVKTQVIELAKAA